MIKTIFKIFYILLSHALLPWILVRHLWQERGEGDIRQSCQERLGYYGRSKSHLDKPIWIHAVSMGEVQAASLLIQTIRQQYPSCPIILTTTTLTGRNQAKRVLGAQVVHRYAPYDFLWSIQGFLNYFSPRCVIILETEWWYFWFKACARRDIPIILTNIRLSAKSLRGYFKIQPVIKEILTLTACMVAQTRQDAHRLQKLGARKESLYISGNIKFDILPPPQIQQEGDSLRKGWGKQRPVWIAASTHEGEEVLILAAHRLLKAQYPSLLLILVPRHPQRFETVDALCRQQGWITYRRQQKIYPMEDAEIFLGDSMGELMLFYAASDIAFIGGSLVPVGGHNMLEAAALGKPTLFGPHLFNFQAISQMLLKSGGSHKVTDIPSLVTAVDYWLKKPDQRALAGESSLRVLQAHQGACQKTLRWIDPYLEKAEYPHHKSLQ